MKYSAKILAGKLYHIICIKGNTPGRTKYKYEGNSFFGTPLLNQQKVQPRYSSKGVGRNTKKPSEVLKEGKILKLSFFD